MPPKLQTLKAQLSQKSRRVDQVFSKAQLQEDLDLSPSPSLTVREL
jgi:hypothetical protein